VSGGLELGLFLTRPSVTDLCGAGVVEVVVGGEEEIGGAGELVTTSLLLILSSTTALPSSKPTTLGSCGLRPLVLVLVVWMVGMNLVVGMVVDRGLGVVLRVVVVALGVVLGAMRLLLRLGGRNRGGRLLYTSQAGRGRAVVVVVVAEKKTNALDIYSMYTITLYQFSISTIKSNN